MFALPGCLVVCPTRDRPSILASTLRALCADFRSGVAPSPRAVLVIDDSIKRSSCRANHRLIENNSGLPFYYHGRREQEALVRMIRQRNEASYKTLLPFIRPLGHSSWNIGAVRNYAALLTLLWTPENTVVVLIDDDVQVRLPQRCPMGSLATMVRKVGQDSSTIVGGTLEGEPDLSSVERAVFKYRQTVSKQCKVRRAEVPISGGLLALSSHWLETIPFPQTYNEDWIWLIRCTDSGARWVRSSARAVHAHAARYPIDDTKLNQEQLGDVFFEGWKTAFHEYGRRSSAYRALRNTSYWSDVRRLEVSHLHKIAASLNRDAHVSRPAHIRGLLFQAITIVNRASSITARIEPSTLVRLANSYIKSSRPWRQLTHSVRNLSGEMSEFLVPQ